jgi:hypothetical protein
VNDDTLAFPSKIDVWIPAIIVIGLLSGPVLISMGARHTAMTGPILIVVVIGLAFPAGLLVWMYLSTRYVISGSELTVTCGPLKVVVPIDSISRIRTSRSILSAPALSLSRLEIQYGRFKEVVISPEDRQGFIRAIVARAPNVVLEDLDEYR